MRRIATCFSPMDVPSAARHRLMSLLRSTAADAVASILLCDAQTLRVLSRVVRMSELLEAAGHISLVDAIHSPLAARAPAELAEAMDVIYFISPTTSSLDAALADHEDIYGRPLDKPTYGGKLHFLFSRRLPDALLQRLKASSVVPRCAHPPAHGTGTVAQ